MVFVKLCLTPVDFPKPLERLERWSERVVQNDDVLCQEGTVQVKRVV